VFPLAYWVHNLSPFIIRFSENFGIRYYGLAYVLGFVAGGWLLKRYHAAGRTPLTFDAAMDLVVTVVVGVFLGGRLGYFILYHPETFMADPLGILRVWEGGMASHGGFVGVAVALWVFARWRKISFLHLGDLIVSAAPVGLFLGRVANFINGELWGRPTRVAWAVIFPLSERAGTPVEHMFPRHPSQLYEAATEGLLLLAFAQWRLWKTDVLRQPGRLAGEFLIGYALVRMFCEQFREPDAGINLVRFFGAELSRGAFYSIFLIVAGLALVILARRPASLAPPPKR
jgi:phosphatidylglycerol:prolipoprotein diacylglycerol transferase